MLEIGYHLLWVAAAAVALAAGSYAYALPTPRPSAPYRWLMGGLMVTSAGLLLVSDAGWQKIIWGAIVVLLGVYLWLTYRGQS